MPKINRIRILTIVIILIIVVAVFIVLSANAPDSTAVTLAEANADGDKSTCLLHSVTDTCLVFPTVSGENLDSETLTFPDDFAGAFNLVIVPFDRDQQVNASAWIPLAKQLSEEYRGLQFYSIAALPDLAPALRVLVTGGMSVAISDPDIRRVSVVLFLEDQAQFLDALDIPDDEAIQLFLLNQRGEVLWRSSGDYDYTYDDTIRAALALAGVAEAN